MNKNLLMVTGLGSAEDLVRGKHGAFYHTLEELHSYFDRIDIIIPKVKKPETTELFGNVHLHVSSWPLLFHPIYFILKGIRLCRTHKIDLMTVHDFPPFYNGIGAFVLSRFTGVPYVLEIHHIPGYPKAASFKEWLYRIYCSLFVSFDALPALWVRVVNQQQTKKFLTRSGVSSAKIRYIPSMYIDTDRFRSLDLPKKYDLVFVSRLERNKNIASLINAVEILKKEKQDISLMLVGTGPLEAELKNLVSHLGLEHHVTLAGWVSEEDHVKLLNESRIFVNPSFNEGGPRVAVEAMACGLPVITTKVGLMLDAIEEGKNGLWCGWDDESIARTALDLLRNPEQQKELGEQARVVALQFKKSDTIRAYATALQRADQKRLLIMTKKVDEHDQLLGFFVEWLRRFDNELICQVLCIEKGTFRLPMSVESLGKEQRKSKLIQARNFFRYIFSHHDSYDVVFVHMSPIWVVAGGWYWRLRGKKVVLWYTSGGVTFKLRVATFFANVVLTASKESFRLNSSKVVVTGHGIDTDVFKPPQHREAHEGINIVTVGRISPVKNLEVLINAARILRDKGIHFHLTIAGEAALEKDLDYEARLKDRVTTEQLASHVTFTGRIDHDRLPALYGKNDLFVHLSNTGSLDKALLEAMACGLRVLSSSDAAKGFLPAELIFDGTDPDVLAQNIQTESLINRGAELRDYVVTYHNLDNLIRKIADVVSAS
jgi:glycogen(starch) synthase